MNNNPKITCTALPSTAGGAKPERVNQSFPSFLSPTES